MKTIKQIEKAVHVEVQKALEKGFFLVKDQHGFEIDGAVCLVGAIVVGNNYKASRQDSTRELAASIIGVSFDDMRRLEGGFELGESYRHDARSKALADIGKRVAEEYNASA